MEGYRVGRSSYLQPPVLHLVYESARPNKRLKLTVRALYIEAYPLRRAARVARSLSAVR